MIEADGLTALADSTLDWAGAATPSIKDLIEACSLRMATDPGARRLSRPLLGELSVRGATHRSAAVRGLSARLSARPGADDLDLASPPIAGLTTDLSPEDRRAYFDRALFPILRGETPVGRAALLDGLKAAVSLV